MKNKMNELFEDNVLIDKIKHKLPKLFQIAELECSRAGKVGMEVGSIREKIIVALLIYKFGEQNVIADIPITEAETDVIVFDNPISIKTITGKTSGVKLIWTVDVEKSLEFSKNYTPSCDMILVQINWSNGGGFYYFTKQNQVDVMAEMGREHYIKLPKQGTNPRGVEMTTEAIRKLMQHKATLSIPINWNKETIDCKPFERWLDLWKQN